MKKIFYLGLAILMGIVFFAVKTAFATSYYGPVQTAHNTESTEKFILQTFKAESSDIDAIVLYLRVTNNSDSAPFQFNICHGVPNTLANMVNTDYVTYCGDGVETVGGGTGYFNSISTGGGEVTYTLNGGAKSLTVGDDYFFLLNFHAIMGGNNIYSSYENLNNAYPEGVGYECSGYNFSTCLALGDYYFKIRTTNPVPQELSFSIPSEDYQYLPISTSTPYYNFSGTCPNPGTKQLYWSFNGNPNFSLTTRPATSTADINCNSDYTWSASKTIQTGLNAVFILDKNYWDNKDATTYERERIYNGYNLEPGYNLSVLYPQKTATTTQAIDYYLIQPSQHFPFQFSYQIPTSSSTIWFFNQEMNSSFTTEIGTPETLNTVSNLDPNNTNIINSEVIADNYKTYYRAGLGEAGTTTPKFIYYYIVDGSGSSTTPPAIITNNSTNQFCKGPWNDFSLSDQMKKSACWLLIGDYQNTINSYKETVKNSLLEKVPFVYFSKIQDEWNTTQATTTGHTISVDLSKYGAFTGTPLQGFSWTLFDFDNPGWTTAHWKLFDFIEQTVLPMLATFFVLGSAIHFFKHLGK